jgi:hypothetical protein
MVAQNVRSGDGWISNNLVEDYVPGTITYQVPNRNASIGKLMYPVPVVRRLKVSTGPSRLATVDFQ